MATYSSSTDGDRDSESSDHESESDIHLSCDSFEFEDPEDHQDDEEITLGAQPYQFEPQASGDEGKLPQLVLAGYSTVWSEFGVLKFPIPAIA